MLPPNLTSTMCWEFDRLLERTGHGVTTLAIDDAARELDVIYTCGIVTIGVTHRRCQRSRELRMTRHPSCIREQADRNRCHSPHSDNHQRVSMKIAFALSVALLVAACTTAPSTEEQAAGAAGSRKERICQTGSHICR